MALGVPLGLERFGRRLLRNDKTRNLAIRSYRAYLKRYLITEYYWNQYLGDGKLLHPYTIIEVNPDRIQKKMPREENLYKEDKFRSRIENGDWDKKAVKFEEDLRYVSIKERFLEDKEWSNTELYKEKNKQIENGEKPYGCSSSEELLSRLQKIDKLYQNILNNGYKRQDEIKSLIRIYNTHKIDSYLGGIDEVLVNIGREGDLIIDEGFHRTSIAKILDIEKMPVRVLAVHSQMREKSKI